MSTIVVFSLILPVVLSMGKSEIQSEEIAESSIPDTLQIDSLEIEPEIADSLAAEFPRRLDRVIPNQAFDVGEKLTFDIKYGFIKAGVATMEVKHLVTVQDSFPSYHIVSTARSTPTFDLVFKVRDSVETFVDARGIFSWKFNKFLREGGYKFDLMVNYDQIFGKAHVKMIRYESEEPLKIRKQEEFEIPIPKYVLDILASFYYVRTQKLEVGMPVSVVNHDNKKIYNLYVIIQRREKIKVKAGTFNCLVVQPRLKGEAIFKQKGKLWVWLTDDDRKIPVLMKSKVLVGSITTELTKIEGIKGPIRAKIK